MYWQPDMRPTIALIDADKNTRESLRALLATLDANVTLYDSAERFLESGESVNCVVSDVSLPGLSGLQLLRQLRTGADHGGEQPNNDTPVILMANESDVRTAVEAMRLGATDFIEKQQLDVSLLRRVSQLLKNDREHTAH